MTDKHILEAARRAGLHDVPLQQLRVFDVELRRMRPRGTFPPGNIPPNAVMTPQNAVDMRRLHAEGRSIRSIAKEYGITLQHASNIIHRKRWKNAEQQIVEEGRYALR